MRKTHIEKDQEVLQKAIRGRQAVHCSLIPLSSFTHRFALTMMVLFSFLYLGIFLKVYVLGENISWVMISPVCIGPLIILYLFELIR